MITILTNKECIHVNLKNNNREQTLVSTIKYHKDNNTGNKIKITSSEFDGGYKFINPSEVEDVYWEDRIYNPTVSVEIEKLLKIFNIKP